jgi:hypothetical protein
MTDDLTRARLLAVYDEQLRADAETPSATAVEHLGPLRLVTFAGGRGFVTYRDLEGADAEAIRRLVAAALDHFRAIPEISRVEWKTRAHDMAPGLHDALLANDFEPDEAESIMIGELAGLVAEVPLPEGVALRQVTSEDDVRAFGAMQEEVFDLPATGDMADALMRRLALDTGMELWVAEADSEIVSTGRLEPVAGSTFAGLWGGATRPSQYRLFITRLIGDSDTQTAL